MGLLRWFFGGRERLQGDATPEECRSALASEGIRGRGATVPHWFSNSASGFAFRFTRVPPGHLVAPGDIFNGSVVVPAKPGGYGWYFDELPGVPDLDLRYYASGAWKLLYIGIAGDIARAPRRTLRQRIVSEHLKGDPTASTLRFSLGYLLRNELRIKPRTYGGPSTSFSYGAEGERRLTDWMVRHARVSWVESESPAEVEAAALDIYREMLPLNIRGNRSDFPRKLSKLRSAWRTGTVDGARLAVTRRRSGWNAEGGR